MTEVDPPASASTGSSNGTALITPLPAAQQNSNGGSASQAIASIGSSGSPNTALVAEPSGSQSPTTSTPGQNSLGQSPKKRRKVNHGKALKRHLCIV
jgi:hypothetical protein